MQNLLYLDDPLLLSELGKIRQDLQHYLAISPNETLNTSTSQPIAEAMEDATKTSSRLNTLCNDFQLSTFERKLLLLCLGVEICEDFATLCAEIHQQPEGNYPTFTVAAAIFPNEANWQVLAPQAPLRYWQFIDCDKTTPISTCRLAINERVLHHLLDVDGIDERLMAFLQPISLTLQEIPSQDELAHRMVQHWLALADSPQDAWPYLHLSSKDAYYPLSVALRACQQLGNATLYQLNANTLPTDVREWQLLQRLLVREVMLNHCVYLIPYDLETNQDVLLQHKLKQLAQRIPLHCILTSNETAAWLNQSVFNIDIPPITQQEQCQLWQTTLSGKASIELPALEQLAQHFKLNPQQIQQATLFYQHDSPLTVHTLWQYCRQQLRQSTDGLARIITPKANWSALVLPEMPLQILKNIAQQVKHRHTVYQHWGFSEKNQRGLGICALLTGPSGTGKTLAAEVIAQELNVDLYHIDLSVVTSKYIGETEKNIKNIFDMAEKSGALLLFDEADSLFSKRTEIKDSHDRYANLGVNYLLQRIEAYQGVTILTTNFKKALDEAFLRRIRFIVEFPFPDIKQRQQIWQKIFPEATPTKNLSIEKLARLNLAGGHIYNIALNASFLAAQANKPVDMLHLQQAVRAEYLKLEQPLSELELKNWS